MTWSTHFAHCQHCGTTENRHEGRGLCSKCYFNDLRKATESDRGHKPLDPRKPREIMSDVARFGTLGLLSHETRERLAGRVG